MSRNNRYSALQAGMLTLVAGVFSIGLTGTGAQAQATCEAIDCKDKTAADCVAAQKAHHEKHLGNARAFIGTMPEKINAVSNLETRGKAQMLWDEVLEGIKVVDSELTSAQKLAPNNAKLKDVQAAAAKSTGLACQMKQKFDLALDLVTPKAVPPATATATSAPPGETSAPVVKPPAEPGTFDNKKDLCEQKCKAPDAYCIDVETGESFCNDVPGLKDNYGPPGKLCEGQSWVVRVAGEDKKPAPDFDLKVGEIKSADQLFAKPAPTTDKKGAAGAPKFMILKEVTAVAPTSSDVTSLEVLFTRKDKEGVSTRFEVPVDHGKHYVDFGVMIPLVFGGKREIVQTPIPGTGGEKRLSLQSELDVNPALVLTVYPFGRRRGLWSAFQRPGAETVSDLFGLQLGVDVDLKNALDRIYAGISLMPIAGVGIGFGAAFVKGDFFPAGYSDGILLAKGETFAPNREYMIQPYFGFTLSTDVLTALAKVKSAF